MVQFPYVAVGDNPITNVDPTGGLYKITHFESYNTGIVGHNTLQAASWLLMELGTMAAGDFAWFGAADLGFSSGGGGGASFSVSGYGR